MRMQRLQGQENVGLLIAAARRRIRQAVGELARPYHLSAQRFWLLLGIQERQGLALNELADRHRIDEPTASRIVAGLARQGLVRIANDPEDRRRSRLLLTAAGTDMAKQLRRLADDFRAAVVEGFSPSERRALAALLRRVVENIDCFAGKKQDNVASTRVEGRS
jgi:MarR family transcriptional regulator for hemolysin